MCAPSSIPSSHSKANVVDSRREGLTMLLGGVSLGLFTCIGSFAVYGPRLGAPLLALLIAILLVFTAAYGLYRPNKISLKKPVRKASASHHSSTSNTSTISTDASLLPAVRKNIAKPVRPAAIVVVDPFSTGAVLAQMIVDRGYLVVRVVSGKFSDELLHMLPAACSNLSFAATIQHEGDVAATVRQIRDLDLDIKAFTIGCESGVEVFDAISAAFGGAVKSNGCELSSARRDKYLMGERVRSAGLRAAKQVETNRWEDVEDFARELLDGQDWENLQLVLKPVRSAGTEDVFFVDSLESARKAFDTIIGKVNLFGEVNANVLVQEFLQGKEYVVDCVSKDGVHKVVAIWQYDKRPCNDAPFVYFGVNLFESADGYQEQKMAEYIFGVLNALGVKQGPTHAEVMWLERENRPCLVEVGARPHGGEGTFTELSTPGIGYNQLSVMLDAIEDNGVFEKLPTRPGKLRFHACEVTLVSREEGVVMDYVGMGEVEALKSFKSIEFKVKQGEQVRRTTDFLTSPGSVMLVHESSKLVQAEAEAIHQMSMEGKLIHVEREPATV